MSELIPIKIVEKSEAKIRSPKVVEGLPDLGLVGAITTSYMVGQLKLKEVAYFESDFFPPVLVVHSGIPINPLRVYGDGDLLVVTSEIALPTEVLYSLSKTIAEWLKSKEAELVISVSGLPVQNRIEIDVPTVYAVGNNEKTIDMLKAKNINIMEEGFIAGFYALLLKEAAKLSLPAIALLPQCFPVYPDPGAAASAINSLNELLALNLDVRSLLEKAEEIRIKARDLMKQTQGTIRGIRKSVEQQLPLMYV